MSDDLELCPFCGKEHRTCKIQPVIGYDTNGTPILGKPVTNVVVSCIGEHLHIPVQAWENRPIEENLLRKLKENEL